MSCLGVDDQGMWDVGWGLDRGAGLGVLGFEDGRSVGYLVPTGGSWVLVLLVTVVCIKMRGWVLGMWGRGGGGRGGGRGVFSSKEEAAV